VKRALVIHPGFTVYGGGELLCLYVCKALLDSRCEVSLACDEFSPEKVEEIFGLGSVMKSCRHIPVRPFTPFFGRGLALQRIIYARKIGNSVPDCDVAFSTQSSLFSTQARSYNFVYDLVDVLRSPEPTDAPSAGVGRVWNRPYYVSIGLLRRAMLPANPQSTHFFALSDSVYAGLLRRGYRNSSSIYPPCPLPFKASAKKVDRIIQVTRIVPQKRLEILQEVARRLPEYEFMIIGRNNPALQRFNPGYAPKFLRNNPKNLTFVNSPVRQVPRLVEESKVYMHTGMEPGIGIALVEAIGAGCMPIAPTRGGGGEVVRKTVGEHWTFNTIDEAVDLVRKAIDGLPYEYSPESLRRRAETFSPEVFMKIVRSVAERVAPSSQENLHEKPFFN
jgi:glycosyltransferase involved in cell wall biosynthesis